MGFIQVPPDSTGKLVDTTIVSGQHRENVILGDPTTAAALGSVLRTPNADQAAGNPLGVTGVPLILGDSTFARTTRTSYAPAVAGHDGLYGKVFLTDPAGRSRVVVEGPLMQRIFRELQQMTAVLYAILGPSSVIPDLPELEEDEVLE